MADMFGAPLGIIASDENFRQNARSGLLAAETLGKIAAQPGERALTEAQTVHQQELAKLNAAQRAGLEATALQTRRMQEIQEQVLKEEAAQRAAMQLAQQQGRVLTAADRPEGGFAAPQTSVAERLDRMANRYLELGAPLDKVVPIYRDAANIAQSNAAAASSQATQQLNQLKAAGERAERLGTMAEYALRGPEQFRQALTAAMQDPSLAPFVGKLPTNFAQAQPFLQNFRGQAMTVKEQLSQKSSDIEAGAAASRANSDAIAKNAAVKVAEARVEHIKERTAILRKTGGAADPTVTALRQERIDASRARRDALDAKQFPNIPLDPLGIDLNKPYTLPNGQRVRAVADPAGDKTDRFGKRFSLIPLATKANDLTAEDLAIINGMD